MGDPIDVKICGLRKPEDIYAAAAAGASYIGFVFFEKSPRYVSFAEAAALAALVPSGIRKVALVVNASDAFLDQLTAEVPLDWLQLHGSETPARVAEVKQRYGLPVMKAVGVADAADVPQLDAYASVADQILVDAKPPRDAELPGGNGLTFDWRLISDRAWSVPWMLAGGLDATNVAQAIELTGARQLDVSSGVETRPGLKDPARIAAFGVAAQGGL